MAAKTLKFRDGFDSKSPDLREDVKQLQRALQKAGYSVEPDGLFGRGTTEAVKAFQRDKGLKDDGVVEQKTWQVLEVKEESGEIIVDLSLLEGFRGDLNWIHKLEGHAGKAYWPGGKSGVTLDPGVDIGHANPSMIERAYKDLLTPEQIAAVKKVFGIKQESARDALESDDVLKSIRISRAQAEKVFPYVAQPYWKTIVNRFPALADSDTLPSVQTAMLSIAYNRGAFNRALDELKASIEEKNWSELADQIGSMQQDHSLKMIRKRRRMEADLIRNELA